MDKMRLARLRRGINLFMGHETRIAPKGTMVRVYGKSPFSDTYLCSTPGHSCDWYVATNYLEFLDETVEDQPEET